jgi:hypothetical protein
LHDFFCRGPDFGFDAAAADGSGDRAIFAHQHARAFVAGDGAVGVDNGGQGGAPAGTAQLDDFFEEVQVFPQSSAYGAICSVSMYASFWTHFRMDATFRNLNAGLEGS